MPGWLGANRLYPGVAEALRAALAKPGLDISIVTTKQARFTHALLTQLGGVDFPLERIFSQTASGRPKTEVLAKLSEGAPPGCRMIFVEDKMSTLEAVAAAPGFEQWQLYLADWGYNTREEKARAGASQRIRLCDIYQFPALLCVGEEAGYARVKYNVRCRRRRRRTPVCSCCRSRSRAHAHAHAHRFPGRTACRNRKASTVATVYVRM